MSKLRKSLTLFFNLTESSLVLKAILAGNLKVFWRFFFILGLVPFSAFAQPANVSECQKALQELPQWMLELHLPKAIPQRVISQVHRELESLVKSNLRKNMNSAVTPREFNGLLKGLVQYARNHKIVISETLDTIGVFPKGVFEIGVSGLAMANAKAEGVTFASLHELAHLFHVVMIRAILIKSYHLDSRKAKDHLAAAEQYLADFEGGMNYIEFEEMVTEVSALPHALNHRWQTKQIYRDNIFEILEVVSDGIPKQHIDHSVRLGLPGIYALFISRVPMVLGKSFGDLAIRMPFILFVTEYLVNDDFKIWVDELIKSIL